jgi:hypothetical protein
VFTPSLQQKTEEELRQMMLKQGPQAAGGPAAGAAAAGATAGGAEQAGVSFHVCLPAQQQCCGLRFLVASFAFAAHPPRPQCL